MNEYHPEKKQRTLRKFGKCQMHVSARIAKIVLLGALSFIAHWVDQIARLTNKPFESDFRINNPLYCDAIAPERAKNTERVRVKTRARTTVRARVWIMRSNLHFCVIFLGFTQRLHFIWMLQLEWLTFARIQCVVYIIFFVCMQCVNAILPFSCEPGIMYIGHRANEN